MKEYKIGNAIVRVRGTVDKEKLREATTVFMTKVIKQRKRKEKEKEQ